MTGTVKTLTGEVFSAAGLGPASAILTQRLGRSPTLAELAAHLSAAEVGVSQMRISRLLAHALPQLRAGMFTTPSSPPTHAPESHQRAGR
jgi:hypothetical protein